jgi:hypothetical protein
MHLSVGRILRGCLVLTILMNTVGCYNFKQIGSIDALPDAHASEELDQVLSSLSVGKTVKVKLRDGSEVEGKVKDYSSPILKIERRTSQGRKEVIDVVRTDIDAIYMKNFSVVKTAGGALGMMGSLVVVSGGVVLLLILLYQELAPSTT